MYSLLTGKFHFNRTYALYETDKSNLYERKSNKLSSFSLLTEFLGTNTDDELISIKVKIDEVISVKSCQSPSQLHDLEACGSTLRALEIEESLLPEEYRSIDVTYEADELEPYAAIGLEEDISVIGHARNRP